MIVKRSEWHNYMHMLDVGAWNIYITDHETMDAETLDESIEYVWNVVVDDPNAHITRVDEYESDPEFRNEIASVKFYRDSRYADDKSVDYVFDKHSALIADIQCNCR